MSQPPRRLTREVAIRLLRGVDSITQAALGAVVGELVLGRRLGRRAIGWGALFGTIPDMDVAVSWMLDTAGNLRLHRGFSHSLLLMLAASFGLAKPLARRWKKEKVTPRLAGAFVFLVWSTHVLIDVFTVYGTQVFEPFSGYRASLDNLFIIDFFVMIPLLVAVGIGLFVKPKDWKKGRGIRSAWWCLGIACFYVALSFWAKHVVSRDFEADLARRGVEWRRKMEAPTPFNILFWRGLVEREGEIWVGYRSVFDDAGMPVRWTVVPKGEEALARHADAREVKTVAWFSKGWWIARDTPAGLWIADLRFGETRGWDRKGVRLQPFFAWVYDPAAKKDRLRTVRGAETPGDAEDESEVNRRMEMLRRMGRRLTGESGVWDGTPRLVTIPPVMAESLTEAK